jgi:hypothetical protein
VAEGSRERQEKVLGLGFLRFSGIVSVVLPLSQSCFEAEPRSRCLGESLGRSLRPRDVAVTLLREVTVPRELKNGAMYNLRRHLPCEDQQRLARLGN